jgi:hypothetical protein
MADGMTEDPGIRIFRLLRRALGEPDGGLPGTCRDCDGMGVIPDTETGAWKVCPTCEGNRHGGIA